jgi:hypothetical protein
MAPITHAVIGTHSCVLPQISTLVSAGYLPGTQWTCDFCSEVHTMTASGGPSPIWVAASTPKPEQPIESMPEQPPVVEPPLEEFVGEIPGEPVPCLPEQTLKLELEAAEPWEEIEGEIPVMPVIPEEEPPVAE